MHWEKRKRRQRVASRREAFALPLGTYRGGVETLAGQRRIVEALFHCKADEGHNKEPADARGPQHCIDDEQRPASVVHEHHRRVGHEHARPAERPARGGRGRGLGAGRGARHPVTRAPVDQFDARRDRASELLRAK
eukprot:CAMPEP_0179887036 /NCGR_PEP_ID=MMETSP0982-20121206/31198_1 /TAXON_ID=483367 /ORGANISM="non described non described, Strain CCMP 2436" /LENGTH=135 /DNA_ID=CAMNT_0021782853 /DNA_START=327 /DNA_END=734 /DNA_ORIENTATION=+